MRQLPLLPIYCGVANLNEDLETRCCVFGADDRRNSGCET